MATTKSIRVSERVEKLPPYLFARIDALRDEVKKGGADVIDLGVGDPDLPTLKPIVAAMKNAVANPKNHTYPAYQGSADFRKSSAKYFKKRTGIALDYNKEVLALIGSKEGIAHLPLAFVDPGDVVLVPDPGYPVYSIATRFCGGEPYKMPLLAKNGFMPDLNKIPVKVWKKAKILFLNYPNNPTGAVATKEFFELAVEKANKYGVLIAHDAAYFELYTGSQRPLSILEIDGAKDVSIEFFSHSKTYNMTGWRIGFAVGCEKAIDALGRIKNNIDSGAFTAVQDAGIIANELLQKDRNEVRKIYTHRRKQAVSVLEKAGFEVFDSGATFYLWVNVPKGMSSEEFTMKALKEAAVVVTPGNGFGDSGEGYFRIALCEDEKRIKQAVKRLAKLA